jgi:hypothetical protein
VIAAVKNRYWLEKTGEKACEEQLPWLTLEQERRYNDQK